MNTRALPALPIRPGPIAAAGLASALAVGVGTAVKPSLGVGLLIGLCYAPLVFINLPLGIALWMALVFIQYLPVVSIGPNAAAVMILVAWLGTLASRRAEVRRILARHRGMFASLVLFLLWLIVSAAWAVKPSNVAADVWQWVAGGLLLLVIAATIRSPRHVRWVAAGFVVGAVVSVLVGLGQNGLTAHGDAIRSATEQGRLQGGGADPNYLAAGLVPAIAMAGGLAATVRNTIGRWALVVAMAIVAVGLAATESRGGLLAAVTTLVAALFVYRHRRAQVLIVVLVLVSMAGVWFATSPNAWHRVTNFNGGGNGRSDIWLVASRVFDAHPVVGVGLNNFVATEGDYVQEPGVLKAVDIIVERPYVVHNTYLQLLAETGVVGLVLFIGVLLGALRALWLAARRFEDLGEWDFAALARAVLVGLVGLLAASFFISNGPDRRLWFLLGLGPALLAVAHRRLGRDAAT